MEKMLAVVAALFVATAAASGQTADRAAQDPDLRAAEASFRAAVEGYRQTGSYGAALTTLRSINRTDLKRVVVNLQVGSPDVTGTPFVWDRGRLIAAGLLHIQAVLDAHDRGDVEEFGLNVDLAMATLRTADLSAAGEPPGSAAPRGLRALALSLLASGDLVAARQLLARGVRLYPSDGPLLLTLGSILEAEAAGPYALLDFTAGGARAKTIDLLVQARALRARRIEEALDYLDRALTADPLLLEARVRSAHVRMLEGDDARGAALLREVLDNGLPRDLRYVALLFIGAIQERSGDLASATASFDEAVQLVPGAQSAYVALSHAYTVRGDAASARAVLERMLAARAALNADDPWWEYQFHAGLGEQLLVDLRRESRR